MQRVLAILVICAVAAFIGPALCHADGDAMSISALEGSSEVAEETGTSFMDRLVVTPVPLVNPTLGAGIIGLGMYMHPEDDFWNDPVDEGVEGADNATRQSITGLGAMGSSTESWMVGAFHKGFYANDRFRGTAYLVYGEFNLKYYGIGDDSFLRDRPIKYSANITAFEPTFMAKVSENWFIGPKYRIFNWDIGINLSDLHPVLPKITREFATAGLGLAGEWDTTDHSLFATKGAKFQFSAMDYRHTWGGDFNYGKIESNYNQYWSLSDRLVLAGRADLNLSSGDTPFFDMPFLHLRGFPYAQYIDKQSASLQTEARYQLSKKWGVNVFGGLGWIGETVSELYKRPVIPTGGAGIRYLIAEEQRMYLGMEAAFGPNSKALYFRVGEYF